MAQSESHVLRAVRLAVGQLPGAAVWRNDCGVATHGKRVVRYGLAKGSADIVGLLSPLGRFLGLEVKRPGEQPTEQQSLWLDLVRRLGGFAAVVHGAADALEAMERARRCYCEQCGSTRIKWGASR